MDASLIVAFGAAQHHLSRVLNIIQKMNRLINRQIHFEWFAMTTYMEVIFDVSRSENAPAHLFFKDKSFWMKVRSQVWWLYVLNFYDDEEWLENFRVPKDTFFYICDRLRPHLEPAEIDENLQPREPVLVEKKVALTLFFLSSCSEYRVIGNLFGVHKSTICKYIHQVVRLVNQILLPEEIRMPDLNECEEISQYHELKFGYARLIGAIDGSHIPILPPSEGYRDFVNRKGWTSVVLQAMVDHKYL